MEGRNNGDAERQLAKAKADAEELGIRCVFSLVAVTVAIAAFSTRGAPIITYLWTLLEWAAAVAVLAVIGFAAGEIVVRAEDRKGRRIRSVAVVLGLIAIAFLLANMR